MKNFKLYGDTYKLLSEPPGEVDFYADKKGLHDEKPKGKLVGYIELDEGEVIACYTRSKVLIILLIVFLVVLTGAGVALLLWYKLDYSKHYHSPDGRVIVKDGPNVVTYSGFPALVSDSIRLDFTNGGYPAKVTVEGDGISADTVELAPREHIDTLPAKFDTEEGVINAEVIITTELSEDRFPIVVEIPENGNSNDNATGLEGFWDGEVYYGPQ